MWHKFSLPSYANEIDANITGCVRNLTASDKNPPCWKTLHCVMEAANNAQQAQFSAASTILGLLPTVLSIISMSIDDLLVIHCRFPVLAFLLALCNPSTISGTLTSMPTDVRPVQKERSPKLGRLLAHGFHLPFHINIRLPLWAHDLILHIVVAGCYAMIAHQALMIGWKGVMVFACWTWHNPFMWVSTGGILHLMQVITWRLCLGPVNESQPWSRWTLAISQDGENLKISRPGLARMWALFFKVTGVMNYGYGTVVLSGMMLVNPNMALRTFVLVSLSGLIAKLVTLWLLTLYPDVRDGEDRVLNIERESGT